MEENPELQPETRTLAADAKPMKVALIAAIGRKNEIGKDNQLMWHLTEDMRFFKETTWRHYIITGRKNFESIPVKYRPLPERVNIIISRDPEFMFEECYTCTSLDEALQLARDNGEERVFIIGGGQIFKMALDAGKVDEMYITHVDAEFPDADVFFPSFDKTQWEQKHLQTGHMDSLNEFAFEIYRYDKKDSAVVKPIGPDVVNGEI